MRAELATGKDLKKVSVFVDKYGNVTKGTITQNLERNAVGGTTSPDRLATGAGNAKAVPQQKATVQVKKCLGCSSPAAPGLDYCNSCKVYIK